MNVNWFNSGAGGANDWIGECGAPTYYRFNASTNGNSVFWYSMDYNAMHFVMLSSEHNYSATAPGFSWLSADLAAVDREKTPWVLVGIHRPLYESEYYAGDNEVSAHLVSLLEPTLVRYGVDMVLGGHYHGYERTCAVVGGQCVGAGQGGIVHVTIGTGGIGLDNALYNDVDWSEFRDEVDWGFGRFYVNATTLVAEFVTNEIGVVDKVVLRK